MGQYPLDPLVLAWLLRRMRPRVYFSPGFNPPLWSPVPFVFTIHDLIHIYCPETVDLAKQAYYSLHRILEIILPEGSALKQPCCDSELCCSTPVFFFDSDDSTWLAPRA